MSSVWNDKVAGQQYVPGKDAKDSERGFGKGARMIQHWAPLDYEDINLISLVIRMIATICLTSNQWQYYASLWFPVISIIFHWLKFFLKVLQDLRNYKEFLDVPSWSYIIDLIDLVLHSSFLKFFLRNHLLPAFLYLLIKCNSSCQGATNLL